MTRRVTKWRLERFLGRDRQNQFSCVPKTHFGEKLCVLFILGAYMMHTYALMETLGNYTRKRLIKLTPGECRLK